MKSVLNYWTITTEHFYTDSVHFYCFDCIVSCTVTVHSQRGAELIVYYKINKGICSRVQSSKYKCRCKKHAKITTYRPGLVYHCKNTCNKERCVTCNEDDKNGDKDGIDITLRSGRGLHISLFALPFLQGSQDLNGLMV